MKERLLELLRHGGPAVWGATSALVTASLMAMSVVDIEPGMAAVRVNNLTGTSEAITQPGWTTRVPGLHSVYLLDASPQSFKMEGVKDTGPLHVRELTVRASDGSNFHFDDTTIIFQLKGDDARAAVRDSGTGTRYRDWLKPYSRAILRDEFGRESTIDVSNPTTYAEATNRAKQRLNEVFGNHGIVVTQLVTPRPKFNDAYEAAIEERNALGNKEQVIRSDLDRAATERERKLAVVDQQKNNEIQQRRAELEDELARAVSGGAEARREADTLRIEKIAEGQAALSASIAKAKELKGELSAKYIAKKAEIDAFRNQPVQKVMQRLGDRLEGITIHIEPYANDAQPRRVKYEEVKTP